MSKYPLSDRPYETLFICPPETPQQTIDAFVDKVKNTIATEKGTFKSVQVWGRRRMTFPIKRHKDGLYIYIDFNGAPSIPGLLNNLFRINDFVLRHMTVERVDPPASPVAPAATALSSNEAAPVETAAKPEGAAY